MLAFSKSEFQEVHSVEKMSFIAGKLPQIDKSVSSQKEKVVSRLKFSGRQAISKEESLEVVFRVVGNVFELPFYGNF